MDWITSNWAGIVAGYLLFIKLITVIRDILDSTPETDDNAFERAVTFLKKLGASLITGARPK